MKTYEDWLPQNSHMGDMSNLDGSVKRAFERINGNISMNIGSRVGTMVLTKLHGEFFTHFSSIFGRDIEPRVARLQTLSQSHPCLGFLYGLRCLTESPPPRSGTLPLRRILSRLKL